jgi:negative regulator of flagellin synthesis FlgM
VKINDSLNSTAGLPSGPQPTRTDKSAEAKTNTSAPPASINVKLSPLSSQLQALQGAQANGAVFETKKVEEIKLAISEGRFKVNSEKVADGLLETVKDLLNARKR